MTEPSLLLLIPAYNEEQRIEPMLREYGRYFQEQYQGKFHLVVVLNGCRDNTRGVVEKVARDFSSLSFLDFPDPIGKGGALIEGLKLAPLADVIGYVDADGASPPHAFHDLVRRLGEADCVIGAFDVNLLVSAKRAGFTILEVPTEWTDKIGSKVTAALFRSSLTMFLSVVRVWLIYRPWIYKLLRRLGLGPLEGWIYRRLRQPQPRPGPVHSPRSTVSSPPR